MNRRWHSSWVVILSAVIAGAGCSTIRSAREAQRGDNVPAGERTLRAAEIGLTSNTVLTLDEAVRLALAYHPSVVQASQSLAVAVGQLAEARAGYGPSASASAGYSQGSSNTEADRSAGGTRESYSAALQADLTLFDFGRTPASVRQAWDRRVAAAASLQAARNDAAFGVRTAFFDLGKAQELTQVAEDAVRQYRARLEQVKAFAEVGQRIRYDVTKVEVDLGNARMDLVVARGEISNARAALNRSLGLAEEPGYQMAAAVANDFVGTMDELAVAARNKHPELVALRAQERAASAAVDWAIAGLYPSLGVQGRYSGGGSDLPLVWNWSLGVDAALRLFTSWQDTAKVDEAVAQLRSARARVADREQHVHLLLSRAWSQLQSARERLGLTDLIVRSAQESLDLIGVRYNLHAASAVELTDAQVALTRARGDQVKARFDHQTALAQIRYAVGEE